MAAFATEGGTSKNVLYVCRKKLVENLDMRQVEWDEKVQNLLKKKASKVKSVDLKQVDQTMSTPNVKYG